ncbi:hypothetical protein ACWIUH_10665 [Ursidibacter arcticus]
MKRFIFMFCFLLTGCYLANGSPSESNYWVKEGKKISFLEKKNCQVNAYSNFDKRFFYLLEKEEREPIEFRKNELEYQEYLKYLNIESKLISKCYYDLGYRFRPPLYWCLAQDGDNTRICTENMKYRN